MSDKTNPGNTDATITNPDQASTNFYWTFDNNGQVFNLQTTVRGVLTFPQVQAHIKTAMEALAHVVELGGQAKQVGRNADQTQSPAAPLPEVLPLETVLADIPTLPEGGLTPVMSEAPVGSPAGEHQFATTHLVCEIRNQKQYFKIKGAPPYHKFGVVVWPEVLADAGIPVAKLDGKEYKLEGYLAIYTVKEDGKPLKVTRLDKVG